jgi:Transglycosylase SLT domain
VTAPGSATALPIAGIAADQAGSVSAGAGGHASLHLAGGLSVVTGSGRAILASGQAAAHAAARPGRSAPAAHAAKQAPGHPADAAGRKAGQHASGGRTVKHLHLDRSAAKVHHATRARKARHAGPCASSTLHWWICSAEHALEQHGVSRSLLSTNAADIVVQHESGANPHAYNGWDSNAAAGHPSEGIAQVIGPTFHAYALPGHHDIWNPVDNMIAAFRYAISRYGSMNSIPGVVAVRQGGSYMGY